MALFRAIATVGGWTMGSRVLGFVRDILIAGVLGAGTLAAAFFVAFKFPNFFRRRFAVGAFNAAFLPPFPDRVERDGRHAAGGCSGVGARRSGEGGRRVGVGVSCGGCRIIK